MSYSAMRRKRFTAGVLAGAMALTVMPILGFTGVAGADHLETADPVGDGNVCEDAPETDPFTDVSDEDPAVNEIRCMVNTEPQITKGTTATTYEPNSSTLRGQMALFLERVADLAEANETSEDAIQALPEGDGETPFTDISDWPAEHQNAIDRLHEAGITDGVTATEFMPGANVTRRQMAKFIVDLQAFVAGEDFAPTPSEDYFDDDNGDSGEDQLNILAEEGVFIGVAGEPGEHNVQPGEDITRRQMAFVLTRKLEVFFEADLIDRLFEEDDVTPTATTDPELQSAVIARTTSATQVTPGNPQGLTVQYCFDEAVTGATPSSADFRIYPNDSTAFRADGAATIDPSNNTCVNVFFAGPQYDTPAEAAALTLAAVDDGAVTDGAGNTNPEGDAPLGSGSTTAVAAGVTSAPDLTTVSGFRQASTVDLTAVEFTFDEPAFTQVTTGFHLVLTNGDVVDCTGPATADTTTPSGGSVPGGNGTTVITVVCDDTQAGQTAGNAAFITAAEVARGYVETGTVGDTAAGGNLNPLQAADVSAAGNSLDPDLVSAAFQPDSTANVDQVLYTFDEPVRTTPVDGTMFCIYYTNSGELCGALAGDAVRSPSNDTQVLVTFPDGALTDAVGASVLPAAVQEITSAGNRFNESDEVAVTPTSSTTVTAGRTNGPDLTNVVLSQATDAFGVSRFVATYVFDEDTADAVTVAALHLYLSDGTSMECNTVSPANLANRTEDQDHTVTCVSFTLTAGGTATSTQVGNAVLGTVDHGALLDEAGASPNPIGAELTSGGTGTPQA